jgi:hypothetical protein
VTEESGRRAVVVGPLAIPAVILVAIGFLRRRTLFVFVGAVLFGVAVKVIDREQAPPAE